MNELPEKLYKYRAFDEKTLRILTAPEVYFADPRQFNDPLDCKPSILPDVGWREAESLWRCMVNEERRPRSLDTPAQSEERMSRQLDDLRYQAKQFGRHDDDGDGTKCHVDSLCRQIETMLEKQFSSHGVFSLAARWDCPLMWSHYAAQHRGICIEFSTSGTKPSTYGRVRYDRPRSIALSQLIRWKQNNSSAEAKTIFEDYFFSKAPDWSYEEEYRLIADKAGVSESPFCISAIYFGLRCDGAVIRTLQKLSDPEDNIDFFSIYAGKDGFELLSYESSADEARAMSGIRKPSHVYFQAIPFD